MAVHDERIAFASYYNWITLFKSIETPLGELAANIIKDPNFPKSSDSAVDIYDYIESRKFFYVSEHGNILETFQYTWLLYKLEIGEILYRNGNLILANPLKF